MSTHPLTAMRAARKGRSLTQSDLAEIVGCTLAALSRIERGDAVPSVETAQRIAGALGVSVDSIWPPVPPPAPTGAEQVSAGSPSTV